MNFCTKTILHYLQHSEGYDPQSRYTIRAAKKLAEDKTIQHIVNRLQHEICHKIEDKGPKIMSRSYLNQNRTKINPKDRSEQNKPGSLPTLNIRFRIPNLTAGKAFSEKIIALEEPDGVLEICGTQSDDELQGFSIDPSTFMIEGTIQESGNIEIDLLCNLLLATGEKQKVNGKLQVSVIPDPRSLWKNLPSDNNARFHKADKASASCTTGSVSILSASVRGRSHAHKGTHRDDDIKILCSSSSGWNIIAVADGAGSCKYSRRGAELAVLRSTSVLRETLDSHYGIELEKIISELSPENEIYSEATQRKLGEVYQQTIVKAVYNAALAIQEEANTNQEDSFKDFSTTLLLAAHKPVEDGHLIFSFWIGDGAAVIYNKQKNVKLLGEPDSGEYAGQTRFLDNKLFDDASIYKRIRLQKVDSMTALILATDGISDAKFETENQLSKVEHWDALWSELEPIANSSVLKQGENELLQWMEFWSAGNHDDRSIAICYVRE